MNVGELKEFLNDYADDVQVLIDATDYELGVKTGFEPARVIYSPTLDAIVIIE
jgi:hypothetical protein